MKALPKPVHLDPMYVRVREVLAKIAEDITIDEHGCHLVDYTVMAGMVRGYKSDDTVSVMRLVFCAIKNVIVGKKDVIVHTCRRGRRDNSSITCVNADHLARGTYQDVAVMIKARRIKTREVTVTAGL